MLNNLFVVVCCRINTFGARTTVGTDKDGNKIEHAVHEYHDTLKNIYLDDFKQSEQYEMFCRDSGKKEIGFTLFKEGALSCSCIQEPTMRVCVDEVETGFSELIYSMKEILRRSRTACECLFCRNEKTKREELKEGKSM